jgi:lipopolysaccharide export LptBFGC system permease protein LptF
LGFSGKYKRNENFFKILFISILIGFIIFLIKEIISTLTTAYNLPFLFSYLVIFTIPLLIGLYKIIKIEID